MKILPISSGKGGVGKTTFALNLSLSLAKRHKTVLLDLDTGTSSLRHFIDQPFEKDLYHFFKKNVPLDLCLTQLNKDIDPEGLFSNLSIIASPRNFIHDVVNFSRDNKSKLIRALNNIDADYLIIDHKAGFDDDILDFVPTGNTGILVFTPKVKAATLSAAEMVKAALLRIFNLLLNLNTYGKFGKENLYKREMKVLEDIIADFEGCYDENKNYDDIIRNLEQKYKDKAIIQIIKKYLNNYKVYFVVNQFNDVQESAKNIINPFIDRIYNSVSSHISITNLGWITEHETIAQFAEDGIPYMVMKSYQKTDKKQKKDDLEMELRKSLGLKTLTKPSIPVPIKTIDKKVANNEMDRQLDLLKEMFTDDKKNEPEQNFDYIADRIRLIEKSSIHNIGMRKIQTKEDIINKFFAVLQKSRKKA